MSGFSADWLALREAADHRSRNPALEGAVVGWLAGRVRGGAGAVRPVRIVDIGCGTGSNLRALAPKIAGPQEWTLVDYDPALLEAARQALAAWADVAADTGPGLSLSKSGRMISVQFRQADLQKELGAGLAGKPDLVTASAFFDLCSSAFIERFASTIVASGAGFYTVLTYNGEQHWQPADPADSLINHAFHAHQTIDKGFGPAAGPDAAAALRTAFERAGYRVHEAQSPWILASCDRSLTRALAAGVAQAVVETGAVDPSSSRRGGPSCTTVPLSGIPIRWRCRLHECVGFVG